VSEASPETTSLLESDIRAILPHRYPFLLLDRVTDFVAGTRIAGLKHFSADDEVVQGNFPDWPLVPTGILLELVTQLGAVLVLERPEMKGKIAMILQIPSARIIDPVQPGDTVRVEAEVLKLRETFGELRGAIYRDGALVAEGQMRFAIADSASLLPSDRTTNTSGAGSDHAPQHSNGRSL
jgi:3-hydroxymyristoyl/3-hydroxydecanoyl-(acyl carrier protein) dehydratase